MRSTFTSFAASSLTLALGLTAAPLLADEDPAPPASTGRSLEAPGVVVVREETNLSPTRSYAWQLLAGFGASDGLLIGSVGTASSSSGLTMVLLATGLAGHVFTGPVVHWAHGHVGKAFASLGLTLGATAVGAAAGFGIGAAAGSGSGSFAGPGVGGGFGAAFGGVTGLLTANMLDAFVLGREARRAPSVVGSMSFAPIIAPRTGGFAVMARF